MRNLKPKTKAETDLELQNAQRVINQSTGRLRCWRCNKVNTFVKSGIVKNGIIWWKCTHCGELSEGYDTSWIRRPKEFGKELYIDIECTPNRLYNYGLKVPSKYIHHDNIISNWVILAWTAKWIYDDNKSYITYCLTPQEIQAWQSGRDDVDKRIMQPLRDLLNDADVVWGHNIVGFDLKMINTRLMKHKIAPYYEPTVRDTLKYYRQKTRHDSNTLDFLAKYHLGEGKVEISKDDWWACLDGDKKALSHMIKYNIGDVEKGIELVKLMRSWVKEPRIGHSVTKG